MRVLIYFFIIVNCIFAFPGSDYKEPASVKKFFPSTPLVVATPSIAPGRTSFTTQREMRDYLGAIHTNNSSTVVNLLGPTRGNNYLPVFVLSRGKELTFKNTSNGKPTVMLIAQQHGDEPMGCDVLMGTIKRIAQGGMNYLLDRVNIVIMPRINPDGAAN
ncbi:MAG: M14 family zinc carboxypeptidase, partial [Cetobacterium sp.]